MTQHAQEALGPVPLLHTHSGYHDRDEPPERVHEEVSLASFDLLGAVKPFFPSSIGGFDGVGSNNRGAGVPGAVFQAAQIPA